MKCAFLPLALAWWLLLGAVSVPAQTVRFSTLAGYAGRNGHDGVGRHARFQHPQGLAIDSADNLYVADTDNHTIRKITPAGVVSTVAGRTRESGSVDATAGNARFFKPQGVVADAQGNLYVADTGNHTIRKITSAGVVSTVAGRAGESGNADGYNEDARFHQPLGVALDSFGSIYVADYGNGRIRKILPDAIVVTVTFLPGPQGLFVDNADQVYVADYASSAVWTISPSGTAGVLAGLINHYGSNDAAGTNAWFYHPAAVAVDSAGQAYVADDFNSTIRKITAGGFVSTLAGSTGMIGTADGNGANARFHRPQGIAVDSAFNVYVADTENSTIRKITPAGVVSTFAGSASAGALDGARGDARFSSPAGIVADQANNLYVTDAQSGLIRKITPAGTVTTWAGFSAQFLAPSGMAMDGAGNLLVADSGNAVIRKITSAETVSTLAGALGNHGYVDGVGTGAEFNQPQGIVLDNFGNIIVADTLNHVIRKISAGGVVSTIAGMGENYGSADGRNDKARFHRPTGLAVDEANNLYVTDCFNHTIRKMTPDGTNWNVTTIAGSAGMPGEADGTNGHARFFQPRGIAVDGGNNLYIVDSGSHTIRKIAPVGTNWVVSTVAGGSGVSGQADGLGGNVRFADPGGIAIDAAGYLCVADSANNTIRVERFVPPELRFTFYDSRAVLSWSALAAGFNLETTSTLSPAAVWWPVNGWTIAGDDYVLTNNVNAGAAFFRLRQP